MTEDRSGRRAFLLLAGVLGGLPVLVAVVATVLLHEPSPPAYSY